VLALILLGAYFLFQYKRYRSSLQAKRIWSDFQKEAQKISKHIEAGSHPFFRAYASTNEQEFFAVAVENFFERPQDFQQEFPKLYSILVLLLKQNPLKKNNLSRLVVDFYETMHTRQL